MKKISVIIPVYNAEKYLDRCVESLTKQTHKNLEIMMIDDGSKDRSLELCKSWQECDSRVVVYHHDNHGVSYTRNFGITHATGDYIAFVDADDWVESDYLETLLDQLLRGDVKIATCGYIVDKGKGNVKKRKDFKADVITFEEALNPFQPFFWGGILSKLYDREVIWDKKDGVLQFDEDIKIAEDMLFWFRAVLRAQKIAVSSKPLYHYCINGNSATMTRNFDSNYSDFTARQRIIELLSAHKELQQLSIIACVGTAWATLWRGGVSKKDPRYCEVKKYVREKGKYYIASPYIESRDKIKMLMSYFYITRKLLTLYERYSNWKNQ